jgi:acetoin utilization deacetylase AcuC-like enzyme
VPTTPGAEPAQRVVLILTDPLMAEHAAPGHPERPERLEAVDRGVTEGAGRAGARVLRPAVVPADDSVLERVHPAEYLAGLDHAAARGGGWIDADTYLAAGSMTAARLAAGAAVQGARAVADGAASVAFAVVRPPGHHAMRARPSGFCLLNNAAVAAMDLRASGRAERVAILDWDVHHGDGTQAVFDADPMVAYASTHQSPLFPGTGEEAERGRGAGLGTMHNAPLAPGDGDPAFVAAWEDLLLPAIERFGPDAILLSAGYDAHRSDPLAHLEVTEAGYERVGRRIGELAGRMGIPGMALTLEGGYDLIALQASAAATVRGFLHGLRGA